MGTMKRPLPVKLFIGMLSSQQDLFRACEEKLAERYGPVDLRSEVVPWTHTAYYRAEMGDRLFREFLFLERLQHPDILPELKQEMIELEAAWSRTVRNENRRRINIDPGYVTEAKVVLATTKDYAHRLYVGGNIYAEVELKYVKETAKFAPLEHTYPDFRSSSTAEWFGEARRLLHDQLHSQGDLHCNRIVAHEG